MARIGDGYQFTVGNFAFEAFSRIHPERIGMLTANRQHRA